MPAKYTDPTEPYGHTLSVGPVNASTYDGTIPVVSFSIQCNVDASDPEPIVYVPLADVEQVVTAIRAAAAPARLVLGTTDQQPETTPANVRDRVAQALIDWAYRSNDRKYAALRRDETVRANAYSRADAVLAVLPAPTDRAAEFELRGDTEIRAAVLRELADEAEESDGHITKQELRRMAALEDRRVADEREAADKYARAISAPPSPEVCAAIRKRLEDGTAPRRRVRRMADEAQQPIERPRCPHCQLPHDLEPGSLPVAACASIRAQLADEAQQPGTEAQPIVRGGRCPVMFEGGGRCEKNADHRDGRWPDDPHTPEGHGRPVPAPADDRCPGFCIPCMTDESHHPAADQPDTETEAQR